MRSLIILTVLLFTSPISESFRLDLQSGHTRCISEDIKSGSLTVGTYTIVNPNEGQPLPDTHKLNVKVRSAYGNTYHKADDVASGQFAFTAPENGAYVACFRTPEHNPEITISVDFEWKSGIEAKDWSAIAKKGSVQAMEQQLKKMLESVTSIHVEIFQLRDREEEMQELSKSTNSQMAVFSFLSFAVCMSVAGFQYWHLCLLHLTLQRSCSYISSPSINPFSLIIELRWVVLVLGTLEEHDGHVMIRSVTVQAARRSLVAENMKLQVVVEEEEKNSNEEDRDHYMTQYNPASPAAPAACTVCQVKGIESYSNGLEKTIKGVFH